MHEEARREHTMRLHEFIDPTTPVKNLALSCNLMQHSRNEMRRVVELFPFASFANLGPTFLVAVPISVIHLFPPWRRGYCCKSFSADEREIAISGGSAKIH